MKTTGLQINMEDSMAILLSDILHEIFDGDQYYWALLFLDGMPKPDKGESTTYYEQLLNRSDHYVLLGWEDVLSLTNKFFQIYGIILLGSKDKSVLHHYTNNEEMYGACDIFIELIDCACWQVFSKNKSLLERLSIRFKDVEFLKPDFNDYL